VEQITIAGKTFNVPIRYEEGHELTAGEASALNQTYHENIRNNLAKKVKEAEEAGAFDHAQMQATVDQYANEYQFGVRVAGTGVTRDPVKSEAMRIAKKQLGEMLRKNGKKIGDYEVAAINAAAQKLIDKDPQIMELARQRVEEQKSLAQQDLGDILGGLTEKAPEASDTAATSEAA
jgi:hypothetical protein